MPTVAIDPGHGGMTPIGGASAAGVVGARGTLEKTMTLAVALAARTRLAALGHRTVMTRDDDRAVSLSGRARAALAPGVEAFVSLHFDADGDAERQGTTLIARDGPAHDRLAGALDRHLARATGFGAAYRVAAPLHVLGAIGDRVAACHVELAFLSDPREEARLADAGYIDRLGRAIAEALDEVVAPPLDIWWEVPLVPQVTGMSCWAAAAAMLIGWRDSIHVDPEEVARAAGRWAEYKIGLEASDVREFAAAWQLEVATPDIGARQLRELLTRHGPVWVGEASPGLHVVVVTGMFGDGTDAGTRLRVLDPWPVGRGERYTIPLADLARTHQALAGIAPGEALVLHAGGRVSDSRAARRPHRRG